MNLTAEQKRLLWGDFIAAWDHAAHGHVSEANRLTKELDLFVEGRLNHSLSMLRHCRGAADGFVVAIPPSETEVISFQLPAHNHECSDAFGLKKPRIDPNVLEASIARIIAEFNSGFHAENIRKELPHVMVMSTGRCGTVSLFRLFEQSHLLAYHTFWWQVSSPARFEMLCRVMSNNFDNQFAMHQWCQTRAAEWLGAVNLDRPMIGLNHTDTIFAPVFAALHRQSKFVYLRRDPDEVFTSFYGKNQWGSGNIQLQPILCAFDPDFRWRRCGYDVPTNLAWYLHFTEVFCRAFGRVLGDRFIEVDANKLFARDRAEIEKLITFTGAELDIDDAVEHFAVKLNQKLNRSIYTEEHLEAARGVYRTARDQVIRCGRL